MSVAQQPVMDGPGLDRRATMRQVAISVGQYTLAAVLAIALLVKLLFLQRTDLHLPLSYQGDAVQFELECKATRRAGIGLA